VRVVPGSSRACLVVNVGVGDELVVDGVGDVSLERPKCCFAVFAFVDLASVVDAPGCVVGDLGDRGDVDGVVQLAVTVAVQAVFVARRC